jgi:DNA-binding transcriptional regulator LsrR (DeoR family)
MARLNISIPDDLYTLTLKWRSRVNLSEVCARALQQELEALEIHRNLGELLSMLQPPTALERAVVARNGLSEALVADASPNSSDGREVLGQLAAKYLNRYLCDDALLAIGGGRQMWCVVRNLTARHLRISITGLGVGQNDPRVLHAHSNTLTTLLWLLFSPRSEAQIVGQNDVDINSVWNDDLPTVDRPKYFAIGSCGPFGPACHLVGLLGEEATRYLLEMNVCGDYLYQFFDVRGNLVPTPPINHKSILPADLLRRMSRRSDSRIILVAGGSDKLTTIKFTLAAGLCNVLITDSETAQYLLKGDSEDLRKEPTPVKM